MGDEPCRIGTGTEVELYSAGGRDGTVLYLGGQVRAVFTDPDTCRGVVARLNATVERELPAVAAEAQRREDLAAEFRRQMGSRDRQLDRWAGRRRKALEQAERYRRAAAALTETSAAATMQRHQLWAQASAVYQAFDVAPPRIEGIDPDPLDRISQTTTGG